MKSEQHYQDQGFEGFERQTVQIAFRRANEAITNARNATPIELRSKYESRVRWEGDGYGWYWILR